MAFTTDFQTVTDTTFNDAGDTLTLTPKYPNSDIQFTATDADQQRIDLQEEQGSAGSGSWKLVKKFPTGGSATIDYTYRNKTGNPVRILLVTDAGGSNSVSLIEKNHVLGQFKNDRGEVVAYHDKVGTYFPEQVGSNLTSEVRVEDELTVEDKTRAAITATATLTKADHANRTTPITVGGSTITLTLPSSTGSGDYYEFLILANATPSSVIVSCDADAGAFVGGVGVNSDASGVRFVSDGVNDLFTMNGTTTGGLPGTLVRFTDAATDFWAVSGELRASGAEATPFSGS